MLINLRWKIQILGMKNYEVAAAAALSESKFSRRDVVCRWAVRASSCWVRIRATFSADSPSWVRRASASALSAARGP